MLKELIEKYSENFYNEDYPKNIAQNFKIEDIITELELILKSDNINSINPALQLIRDFCIEDTVNISHAIIKRFRNLLPYSNIFSIMNKLLYHVNLILLKDVVYTFGKINFQQNIVFLKEAYKHYRDKDPLILPDLLHEIDWLKKNSIWQYIDDLVDDPNYIFRWSAVDLLSRYNADEYNSTSEKMVILANDVNKFVSSEAKQYLQLQSEKQQIETLSDSEFRDLILNMDDNNLSITFSNLVNDFCNYQKEHNSFEYIVEDIESFIEEKIEEQDD